MSSPRRRKVEKLVIYEYSNVFLLIQQIDLKVGLETSK